MALAEIQFDDALMVRSSPIVVRGYPLQDRFGHSIFVEGSAGELVEILRSQEGDSNQDFPPSGPMQELVAEVASVGKAPVLMGLGSAGKSTWSCSIEGDATIESVAFDFACKTRSLERFGSTYQLTDRCRLIKYDEHSCEFEVDHAANVCLRCFGQAKIEFDQQAATLGIIAPIPASDLPPSQKGQRRWRYVVGLASSLVFASDEAAIQ